MSIKINSTEQLVRGYGADCRLCGAGSLTCFNFPYAKKHPSSYNLYVYECTKKLRVGSLFECKSCGNSWYLDEDELFMNFIPKTRLELIEHWNASPIILSRDHLQVLKKIGSTSSDIHENDRNYCETPCKVVAKNGEVFNFAIIVQQRKPPFEGYKKYRLASEIQEIQISPFVLSLEVRVTTMQAEEIHNGFAPTIVEKPNGQRITFNWAQHFYDHTDCLATDIKVVKNFCDWHNLPYIYQMSSEVTYFIADY